MSSAKTNYVRNAILWLRVVPYANILSGTIFNSEIKHPINSQMCGEGKIKYMHQLCVVCQDNVH